MHAEASPEIELPDVGDLLLELDAFIHVENNNDFDRVTVYIRTGKDDYTPVIEKQQLKPLLSWNHREAWLDAFKGKKIRVYLELDTVDEVDNKTEGAYFDNITVSRSCD